MVRFIWDCMGRSNRTPLPSCVYHAIRSQFPSQDGDYKGFEEPEEKEEEVEDDKEVGGD